MGQTYADQQQDVAPEQAPAADQAQSTDQTTKSTDDQATVGNAAVADGQKEKPKADDPSYDPASVDESDDCQSGDVDAESGETHPSEARAPDEDRSEGGTGHRGDGRADPEKVKDAVATLNDKCGDWKLFHPSTWWTSESDANESLKKLASLQGPEREEVVRQLDPEVLARLDHNTSKADAGKFKETLDDVSRVKTLEKDENTHVSGKSEVAVDGKVTEKDVIQNPALNDCYLAATMAGIAKNNPDAIKDMVQPVPGQEGKYTVKLYKKDANGNMVPELVTVDQNEMPSADGEHAGMVHSPEKGEIWPAAIEAAYAKQKGSYQEIDHGNSASAFEALLGTEGSKVALDNGKNADGTYKPLTAAQSQAAYDEMKKSLDGGGVVVAGTGNHVQTVTDVYEKFDANGNSLGKYVKYRDQMEHGTEGAEAEDKRNHDVPWDVFQSGHEYARTAAVPKKP